MNGVNLTGHPIVDKLANGLNFKLINYHAIPIHWYSHLKTPAGKTDAIGALILADIVFWYTPKLIEDELTGEVIGYKKRFKGDILQKSYSQLADRFGFSKEQIKDACKRLEEKGLIKMHFRTIPNPKRPGKNLGNVPFIELIPEKVIEISYPEISEFDEHDPYGEISPEGAIGKFPHRLSGNLSIGYGEISPDIYRLDNTEKTTDRPTEDNLTQEDATNKNRVPKTVSQSVLFAKEDKSSPSARSEDKTAETKKAVKEATAAKGEIAAALEGIGPSVGQGPNAKDLVFAAYREHIGLLGPRQVRELSGFIEKGIEPEVVAEAIKFAASERKEGNVARVDSYLFGVLRNCHNEGTTTLAKWQVKEDARKERLSKAGSYEGIPNAGAYIEKTELLDKWRELYPDLYDSEDEET